MPYYLVTQTSLVEADDEVAAAGKALEKLRSDPRVTFAVKYDDTVSQVVVEQAAAAAALPDAVSNPPPVAASTPDRQQQDAKPAEKAGSALPVVLVAAAVLAIGAVCYLMLA